MSDMTENPEAIGEEVVDLDAIGEKFEDKGYFTRLKEMFIGLGKPKDSPEYKLARTELQRQAAPLIAVVLVALVFLILWAFTKDGKDKKKAYDIETIQQEEVKQEDEPPEDEPPPDDPDDTPMEDVDIPPDPTMTAPPSELPPSPTPPSPVVSVKPAEQDAVANIRSPVTLTTMQGGDRTGRIGKMTGGGAGYGNAQTEAAVLKVLWWLKHTQKIDPNNPEIGYWSGGASTLANTALAVLTYLAHGEYPGSRNSPYRKEFGPVVEKAMNYLIASVIPGSTPKMKGADGNEYAFLIATYALCEAYGMTRNDACKDAAMICLDRIVKGQSQYGGWDYKINPQSNRDDMSFAGWALQALKAGKMADMHPEGLDTCIKKAVKCLKTRNFKNGGFNYVAGGNPTGLTATGCLAMQLLGYGGEPEVKKALEYMRNWTPTFDAKALDPNKAQGSAPQYYCYYATQCKYQAGMKDGADKADFQSWVKWNAEMQKLYTTSIIDEPTMTKDSTGKDHKMGHYVNTDAHTSRPVMDTCLVALQLMVYYRYLPTNQLKAGAENAKTEAVEEKTKDEGEIKFDTGDF